MLYQVPGYSCTAILAFPVQGHVLRYIIIRVWARVPFVTRACAACSASCLFPQNNETRKLLLLFSHELIAAMQSVVTGQAPTTLERKITSIRRKTNKSRR